MTKFTLLKHGIHEKHVGSVGNYCHAFGKFGILSRMNLLNWRTPAGIELVGDTNH